MRKQKCMYITKYILEHHVYLKLQNASAPRIEDTSTSLQIPPAVRSHVWWPRSLEADSRFRPLPSILVSFSWFSSASPASHQNPKNQIYTTTSASPSHPLLFLFALSPSFSWRCGRRRRGRAGRRRPSSFSSSALPSLPPLPSRGGDGCGEATPPRRRRASAGGAQRALPCWKPKFGFGN
jgi:hypothetical protein